MKDEIIRVLENASQQTNPDMADEVRKYLRHHCKNADGMSAMVHLMMAVEDEYDKPLPHEPAAGAQGGIDLLNQYRNDVQVAIIQVQIEHMQMLAAYDQKTFLKELIARSEFTLFGWVGGFDLFSYPELQAYGKLLQTLCSRYLFIMVFQDELQDLARAYQKLVYRFFIFIKLDSLPSLRDALHISDGDAEGVRALLHANGVNFFLQEAKQLAAEILERVQSFEDGF